MPELQSASALVLRPRVKLMLTGDYLVMLKLEISIHDT